jgi:hypothetical protein
MVSFFKCPKSSLDPKDLNLFLLIIGRGRDFVHVLGNDFIGLLFPRFIELNQELIPKKNFRLEL